MNREERRRRAREELRGSRPLRKTPSGMDYVVGPPVVPDPDRGLSDRITAFIAGMGGGTFTLARAGYRDFGRGAVLVEARDVAWLDRPPPDMPILYVKESAIIEYLAPGGSRDEALRKVSQYNPDAQAVVVVVTPHTVLSTTVMLVKPS